MWGILHSCRVSRNPVDSRKAQIQCSSSRIHRLPVEKRASLRAPDTWRWCYCFCTWMTRASHWQNNILDNIDVTGFTGLFTDAQKWPVTNKFTWAGDISNTGGWVGDKWRMGLYFTDTKEYMGGGGIMAKEATSNPVTDREYCRMIMLHTSDSQNSKGLVSWLLLRPWHFESRQKGRIQQSFTKRSPTVNTEQGWEQRTETLLLIRGTHGRNYLHERGMTAVLWATPGDVRARWLVEHMSQCGNCHIWNM